MSGSLRGRKLNCNVNPHLRPTPQRVREALFNILRHVIPERPFIDIFAGTGVVGLEALSLGAADVTLIEQDHRQAQEIRDHIDAFRIGDGARVLPFDAYRWVRKWEPPTGPVNIYISPPFPHIQTMTGDLVEMITTLQEKAPPESVIVLQSEHGSKLDGHAALNGWDKRRYGRNHLMIWQKGSPLGANDQTAEVAEDGEMDSDY